MKLLPLITILALSIVTSAFSQEKVILKLSLKKGKTYYSDMVVDQTVNMKTKNNGNISIKQTMGFGYDMVVSEENAEGQTIKTTYQKIKVKINELEYDSENPEKSNPDLSSVFKNLVGKSFTLKVNKAGIITSLSGLNDMVAAMIKDTPLNPQIEAALKSNFNDKKFLEDFSKSFNIFPEYAVKLGDSWTKNQTSTIMGNTENDVTYTLQKLTPSTAGMQINNSVKVDMDAQGAKTIIGGQGSGTIEVDRKSGFPISSRLILKLTGSVSKDKDFSTMDIISTYTISGSIK